MEKHYNLVVIGAGPGGYVAAVKAAQLGMQVAVIESRELGGTCLNRGCIPTKTLMHSSHLYYEAQHFNEMGLEIQGLSYDIGKIQDRKDEVVQNLRNGVSNLLKSNNIDVLLGTGTIETNKSNTADKQNPADKQKTTNKQIMTDKQNTTDNQNTTDKQITTDKQNTAEKQITITSDTGIEYISTDKILIATGSKPIVPAMEGIHLPNVVTSDELLSMKDKVYQKLLIIGGGVIGVEFATIYRELGCEVVIVEAQERILPTMDREISQSVAFSLKKKGVKIFTSAHVERITESTGLTCHFVQKEQEQEVEAEGILVSIGRRANTEHLFGEGFELTMDRDKIVVNDKFETSISGIYAIGDVIKGMQLAHMASAQGTVAVEYMNGKEASIDLSVVPSCIYTTPEIASVGLTEDEAKQKGFSVITGKYPMLANSKTIISSEERGYIKVVFDSETDKLLGAQLLCSRATDIVGEFATAIVSGSTRKQLASVIRPHPTYEEAITETVESASKR